MTTEKTAPAEQAPSDRPLAAPTPAPRRRTWLTFLRDVLRHHPHRGAGLLPRQDLPGALVLHPVGVDGGHAPHQRPDPGRRGHPAIRRVRPWRHRGLPRSGRLAAAGHRAATTADHRGDRLGALARRTVGTRQRRSSREADHRASRRSRRVLQRARPDHRQRRADRRDRLREAAGRGVARVGGSVRRRRARGQALGARRQSLSLEGFPLQPGSARRGLRSDRERGRAAPSSSPGRSNRFGLLDFHHDVFAGVPDPVAEGAAP